MGTVRRIDRPKPWLARYQGPDGRQHSKTFARKAEGEAWLRGEESRIDRAEWIDPRGGTALFSRYAETWQDGLHDLKPKTVDGYRWHLNSRVLPTFGDRRLRSIKPTMIREWQNGLLANGLSAGTVRQSRQVLSLVLGQAVNDGILARNPVDKVKPPTVRPRRQRFLAADQLDDLADECGDYGPLIWFLGWSGLLEPERSGPHPGSSVRRGVGRRPWPESRVANSSTLQTLSPVALL